MLGLDLINVSKRGLSLAVLTAWPRMGIWSGTWWQLEETNGTITIYVYMCIHSSDILLYICVFYLTQVRLKMSNMQWRNVCIQFYTFRIFFIESYIVITRSSIGWYCVLLSSGKRARIPSLHRISRQWYGMSFGSMLDKISLFAKELYLLSLCIRRQRLVCRYRLNTYESVT